MAFYSIMHSVYFDIKFFFTRSFQVKESCRICHMMPCFLTSQYTTSSQLYSTSSGSQSSSMATTQIQVWIPSLPLSKPLHLLKTLFSHLSNRFVMGMKYMKYLDTGSSTYVFSLCSCYNVLISECVLILYWNRTELVPLHASFYDETEGVGGNRPWKVREGKDSVAKARGKNRGEAC